MSEPITWAAVGMAAVSNMATWLTILKARNGGFKKNNNPENKPGTAKICRERGEKLAILETKLEVFERDIKEIKESIKEIMEILRDGRK